jgi:hypothetical protein
VSDRIRAGIFITLVFVLAACSGTGGVPTPINSALASVDLASFCQGRAPTAQDLQAAVAAATSAAAGSGFTMENAAARIDSAIAGLRGLSVSGDAATARDQLASALERLKSELPNPSAETLRATSQAAAAFETAKTTFCR